MCLLRKHSKKVSNLFLLKSNNLLKTSTYVLTKGLVGTSNRLKILFAVFNHLDTCFFFMKLTETLFLRILMHDD